MMMNKLYFDIENDEDEYDDVCVAMYTSVAVISFISLVFVYLTV